MIKKKNEFLTKNSKGGNILKFYKKTKIINKYYAYIIKKVS